MTTPVRLPAEPCRCKVRPEGDRRYTDVLTGAISRERGERLHVRQLPCRDVHTLLRLLVDAKLLADLETDLNSQIDRPKLEPRMWWAASAIALAVVLGLTALFLLIVVVTW